MSFLFQNEAELRKKSKPTHLFGYAQCCTIDSFRSGRISTGTDPDVATSNLDPKYKIFKFFFTLNFEVWRSFFIIKF